MEQYHKIRTVYLRDPETKFKTLQHGIYATPEFKFLRNNNWLYTEKVDGTNLRVIFGGESVCFKGKSDRAQIPVDLTTRLNERFLPQIDLFKKTFPGQTVVCLYGEGYGPKIQNGGKYRTDQDFVLFDVYINDHWLDHTGVVNIANIFEIDVVPFIGEGTLSEMVTKAREGFSSAWGDFLAEGIVARPQIELRTSNGQRIITKIKYEDFQDH